MTQIAAEIARKLSQPLAAAGGFVDARERTMQGSPRHGYDRLLFGSTKARDQIEHASAIVLCIRRFIQRREPKTKGIPVNETVLAALTLATPSNVEQLELSTNLDLDPSDQKLLADRVELQPLLFNLIRSAIEAVETSSRKGFGLSIDEGCLCAVLEHDAKWVRARPRDLAHASGASRWRNHHCREFVERTTFAVRIPYIAFRVRQPSLTQA